MQIYQDTREFIDFLLKNPFNPVYLEFYFENFGQLQTMALESTLTSTSSTNLPTLTSDEITTSDFTGTIVNAGSTDITRMGVVYSDTNVSPTIDDTVLEYTPVIQIGEFIITNLFSPITYARAFAENDSGISYGIVIVLANLAEITSTSFTYNQFVGSIVSNGGSTITAMGMVYGPSRDPTLANNVVQYTPVIQSGDFTIDYDFGYDRWYGRSFATNSVGTSYGNGVNSGVYPVVSSTSFTQETGESADTVSFIGNLASAGSYTMTLLGVVYGANPSPTYPENTYYTVADPTQLGSYTIGPTYFGIGIVYARAFAVNIEGSEPSYGDDITLDIQGIEIPLISVSFIQEDLGDPTSVSFSGNLTTSDAVSLLGVVYGPNISPVYPGNNYIVSGTPQTGNYTNGPTYYGTGTVYARAFAVKEDGSGTIYGYDIQLNVQGTVSPPGTTVVVESVSFETLPVENNSTVLSFAGNITTTGSVYQVNSSGFLFGTDPNLTGGSGYYTNPVIKSGYYNLESLGVPLSTFPSGSTVYARATVGQQFSPSVQGNIISTIWPTYT